MDARPPTVATRDPSHGARLALVLGAAVAVAGCFLYPSPDDSWSDAYGRPPDASAEASGSNEAGSGPCARAGSECVACCDDAGRDLASGNEYFAVVFACACSAKQCVMCGADCATPPASSEPCFTCLAEKARACPSEPIDKRCPAGSRCHDYATCIAGCQL